MNDINCNDFNCKNNVDGKCRADIVFIDDKHSCISESKFIHERNVLLWEMKNERSTSR